MSQQKTPQKESVSARRSAPLRKMKRKKVQLLRRFRLRRKHLVRRKRGRLPLRKRR